SSRPVFVLSPSSPHFHRLTTLVLASLFTIIRRPPSSPLLPYTPLFRSPRLAAVPLAESSATDTAVAAALVRVGASFTSVTVIESESDTLFASPVPAVVPLSDTVQLIVPVPFASATVL